MPVTRKAELPRDCTLMVLVFFLDEEEAELLFLLDDFLEEVIVTLELAFSALFELDFLLLAKTKAAITTIKTMPQPRANFGTSLRHLASCFSSL